MAEKKRERMECKYCGNTRTNRGPCCDEYREALAKESFNLCTICNKYFDTTKELREHSHKEAA